MTLAIALPACNGLVLGADSRVTSVQLIGGKPTQRTKDMSEKFLQVNRDIGVLTYGLSIPGYNGISRLAQAAKQNPHGRFTTFDGIATEATGIFKEEFDNWLKQQQDPEQARKSGMVGFMLAGYDSVESNQFKIASYQTPDFTKDEKINTPFLAGQWHISQYLIRKFHSPELSVDNLVDVAVFLFLQTMIVEETVGGPIQLATVNLEKGFQRLHEDDIQRIISKLQKRISVFNKSLLELFA